MARQRLWWIGPPIFIGLVILISLDSIQWVFLARVQWVALFALVILPARWISSGYFKLDKSIFVIEPGHIRAAVCFLATSLLYFWLRTKRLAPLCYFLLLMTALVLGLS